MKSQRLIDTQKLGPLEVCADPPMIWWGPDTLQGWRAANIRLLHVLIANPMCDPDELAEHAGLAHGDAFIAKVSDLKHALKISGLGVRIAPVKEEDGRRVLAYKLELTA